MSKDNLPEWIDPEIWGYFLEHRKAIRKKMTPRAETLIIRKLQEFKNQGYNPNDIIDAAIENGWTSVFVPHNMKKSKSRGAWGLDPDHQIQQATDDFLKGKNVLN